MGTSLSRAVHNPICRERAGSSPGARLTRVHTISDGSVGLGREHPGTVHLDCYGALELIAELQVTEAELHELRDGLRQPLEDQ